MVTRAMIMAAGIGSRLDPLTQCKPKPMVPVANVPVMEHILKILKKHGVKDVIANTNYLAPQINCYFNQNKIQGLNLELLHEEELSGTAGGVKKCESFLNKGETFIVMSGDSLTDVDLTSLVEKHKKAGAMISMGLKSVAKEEVVNLGVVVTDESGKILEFQEKPPIEEAKSTLVNTGIYIFEPELFNYIPKGTFYDFAKQVFPTAMADNKAIYGFKINEYWNDIGTLLQYRLSSYDVLNEIVQIEKVDNRFEHGWKGGNVKLGEKLDFQCKVIIGGNSTLGHKITFKNGVTIGDNCVILGRNILDGCLLWDNVNIGSNVHLHNCLIGSNVTISDNAKIEEGAVIADNCIIKPGAIVKAGTKVTPNKIMAPST